MMLLEPLVDSTLNLIEVKEVLEKTYEFVAYILKETLICLMASFSRGSGCFEVRCASVNLVCLGSWANNGMSRFSLCSATATTPFDMWTAAVAAWVESSVCEEMIPECLVAVKHKEYRKDCLGKVCGEGFIQGGRCWECLCLFIMCLAILTQGR